MKFFLDGSDWEAEYYISLKDYLAWQRDPRKLYNMHLQDATAAGFLLADSNCKPSFKATIPGCDRSVLLENGVIQDPYWGRNMDQSRWSEEKSWAFRKFFVLPEEIKNRKRFQLRFCGIDYSATFFLNGEYLGSHTGAFIPFEADVTDCISRDGENLLAVIFEPMPQGLPNHNDPFNPQPTDFAEYHRSQLCFGWDWSRGMSAAGIWDHVYINANDDARISDCCFRGNAEGDVDLSVEIQSTLDARMPLNITLEPMNFQGESYTFTREVELEYGENICSFSLKCAAPQLWYPRGYGRQNLYRLKLEIAGEVTEKQVAFRTLKMLRNANSPERAYNLTFSFNGVPVFARGVNWVPAELMYNRSTREEYERLVRLAAEGNINLFRIWGGGIIEKDDFYALCDQYGIIVWQEFMHACSNYRKDGEYLAFKAREAEAILRKIRNHVCVSMLCGGNEVLYYGEIPDSPLLIQYEQICARMMPHLPYHRSSPDLSRPGERHHGPWHFVEHEVINAHDRLLASEIGCNGFTEFESVKKFIPESEWENPEGQNWLYHFAISCRQQDWHAQMVPFDAKNSAQICQASMAVQGDIGRYWINHCRRKFPHTTGCFFWQYNDPWPTLAFSLVDYYSLPKIAYYEMQRVQKCTTLNLKEKSWFCKDGKFSAELYLTSDWATGDLQASFRLLTADGTELWSRNYCGCWEAGSKLLDTICVDLPAAPAAGVVLAEMKLKRGDEIVFQDTRIYGAPDLKQVFDCTQAQIKAEAGIAPSEKAGEKLLTVTLHNGDFAAFYLRLNLPEHNVKQVYWHDNYVTLAPGETRTVTAAVTGECAAPLQLEITAWNAASQRLTAE